MRNQRSGSSVVRDICSTYCCDISAYNQGGDTLSSRHVTSCNVTRAVGM